MWQFCKAITKYTKLTYIINFSEPGEGKGELDRHFGSLTACERKILVQYYDIIG